MSHVTGGINVNQKSNAGDDEDHHAGQRIDLKTPVGDEFGNSSVEHVIGAGGNPLEQNLAGDAFTGRLGDELKESAYGKDKGKENAAGAKPADDVIAKAPTVEKHHGRCGQREKRNQP